MNDENPTPEIDEPVVPEITDAEAENSKIASTDPDEKPHFDSAHPVDENPLEHVGDEQPDPWAGKEA